MEQNRVLLTLLNASILLYTHLLNVSRTECDFVIKFLHFFVQTHTLGKLRVKKEC